MDFVSNLARSPKQSSRLRFFYPGCVCVCVCFGSSCLHVLTLPSLQARVSSGVKSVFL